MKPLPLTLTTDGFDLEQIQRDENFAIYRQCHPNQSDTFEVIKINKQKAKTFTRFDHQKGENVTISVEEKEKYPRTEAWGEAGWTFQTLELAQERFRELQQKAILVSPVKDS